MNRFFADFVLGWRSALALRSLHSEGLRASALRLKGVPALDIHLLNRSSHDAVVTPTYATAHSI